MCLERAERKVGLLTQKDGERNSSGEQMSTYNSGCGATPENATKGCSEATNHEKKFDA
jgi:hypothetical protein